MMNTDLFLTTTMNLIKSDMLAKLDGGSFKTLMALGTFIDNEGYCHPNQITLAEMTGVSDRSIRRHIETLLEYRTPLGDPILIVTKRKAHTSKFYYNQYLVYPTAADIVAIKDMEDEAAEVAEDSYIAKDIISLFAKLYVARYGYEYRISKSEWAQFTRILTQKVVKLYPDKELAFKATKILVDKYDELFKKPNYPAPTLWDFTTWVFAKCIDMAKVDLDGSKELDERIEREQAKAEDLLSKIETDEDVAALFARKRR